MSANTFTPGQFPAPWFEHLPGPWELVDCDIDPETSWILRQRNGGRQGLYIGCIDKSIPSSVANARLITSAPDLLAACEAALEVAKISFNPHPEDEASTITLGRGTLQHLANHLAGAIAKARGV